MIVIITGVDSCQVTNDKRASRGIGTRSRAELGIRMECNYQSAEEDIKAIKNVLRSYSALPVSKWISTSG